MKKIFRSLILAIVFGVIAFTALAQLPTPPANFDKVQNVPHGTMKVVQYYSTTVGTNRNVRIYTPPGYSKDKSYNVLYLMHGVGGDENEWNTYCKPGNILDNLFAQGKLKPMVVVFPNGRAMKDDRATGDIYAADKQAAFGNFEFDLIKDLIPYIEKNYSVIPNRLNRAIAGYSMGGGQSLNIGLRNLNLLAWVGSFACAPNAKSNAELVPNVQNTKNMLKLLWLSCGDADGLFYNSKRVHDFMTQKGISHIWQVEPGIGHATPMWQRSLYNLAPLLFQGIPMTTDLDEEAVEAGISFFPNPFTSEITVTASNANFIYSVFDMAGTLLEKGSAHASATIANNLPSGVYIIKIETETKSKYMKVVKN